MASVFQVRSANLKHTSIRKSSRHKAFAVVCTRSERPKHYLEVHAVWIDLNTCIAFKK